VGGSGLGKGEARGDLQKKHPILEAAAEIRRRVIVSAQGMTVPWQPLLLVQ
jgi:hypothetical protein